MVLSLSFQPVSNGSFGAKDLLSLNDARRVGNSGKGQSFPGRYAMIDCRECKERLYPENPEQPFYDPQRKRYLPPLCQGCPNAYLKQEAEELPDRLSKVEAILANHQAMPRQHSRKPVNQPKMVRGVIL